MNKTRMAGLAMVAAMVAQAGSLKPHVDALTVSDAGGTNPPTPLTLLVVNQAGVPDRQLGEMFHDLDLILHRAGIRASFVVCPISLDLPRSQTCSQSLWPDRILVELLPGQPDRRLHSVGTSTVRRDTGTASIVVFAHLAELIAKAAGWSWPELLAHLAGHEIGHVLLETNDHARNGIMRAIWSPGELAVLRPPQVLFDQHQARKMRDTLTTRRLLAQVPAENR